MAFQQPTFQRQSVQPLHAASSTHSSPHPQAQPSDSQEWILFAPSSQVESSTHSTEITRTPGLSRTSGLDYFGSILRSGQPGSSILEDDATEDAELDSLDDGLHAFREPVLYPTTTHHTDGHVLPAHDGLGSFQASSAPVLEQLWQHEQFNMKRPHGGHHRRRSSVQRHLDTIDEFEAQASEEKRIRIEQWRIDQSQAFLEEVEKETRKRSRKTVTSSRHVEVSVEDLLGTTPRQSDYSSMASGRSHAASKDEVIDSEPFWRRITRKFIRDIIGIDDPLLSVILGESLPGDATPRAASPTPEEQTARSVDHRPEEVDVTWRDKLLQRIAHELGVFPEQLTPHPGAFSTYPSNNADYAGMPVNTAAKQSLPSFQSLSQHRDILRSYASSMGPKFPPTLRDTHVESWGIEDEPVSQNSNSNLDLQKEREYWERQLDVKMVFRFLKDRFSSSSPAGPEPATQPFRKDDSAARTAIIRQHHPLVNRSHHASNRIQRDARVSVRRSSSSCASESLKGSRKASILRSGSSRNYWDIGGSAGSGSIVASGGMMGAWGQA